MKEPYNRIVCALGSCGETIAEQVASHAVATLKAMPDTASGEDSGLTTVWDHYSMQVESGDYSAAFRLYEDLVEQAVMKEVKSISEADRLAIWVSGWVSHECNEEIEEWEKLLPVPAEEVTDYVRSMYVDGSAVDHAEKLRFEDRWE